MKRSWFSNNDLDVDKKSQIVIKPAKMFPVKRFPTAIFCTSAEQVKI